MKRSEEYERIEALIKRITNPDIITVLKSILNDDDSDDETDIRHPRYLENVEIVSSDSDNES